VTLVETQHRLALEQLRRAGEQPVSLAALRAAGLDFPAAVISELELNGHVVERVYEHGRLVGLRLIEPEEADTGQGSPPLVVPAASIGWPRSTSPGAFTTGPGQAAGDTQASHERRVGLIIADGATIQEAASQLLLSPESQTSFSRCGGRRRASSTVPRGR
jgi:hypothetical protein